MDVLILIVFGLVFFIIIHKNRKEEKKRREETARRKSLWNGFMDDISEEDFINIVTSCIRPSNRIKEITTKGPIVYGTVYTQSRLSEWDFEIDFNDYGHITGSYWLTSDNDDSSIPRHIAESIKEALKKAISDYSDDSPKKEFIYDDPEKDIIYKEYKFCPYCGKPVANPKAVHCTFCGKEMRPRR